MKLHYNAGTTGQDNIRHIVCKNGKVEVGLHRMNAVECVCGMMLWMIISVSEIVVVVQHCSRIG